MGTRQAFQSAGSPSHQRLLRGSVLPWQSSDLVYCTVPVELLTLDPNPPATESSSSLSRPDPAILAAGCWLLESTKGHCEMEHLITSMTRGTAAQAPKQKSAHLDSQESF